MLDRYKERFLPLLEKIKKGLPINKSKHLLIDIIGSRLSGKNQASEEFCCLSLCVHKSVVVECFRYMNRDKDELDKNMYDAFQRINALYYLNRNKYNMKINSNYVRIEGVFTQNRDKVKIAGRYQPKAKYKIIFIDEFFEFEKEDVYLDIKQAIRNYENLIVIRIANPWLENHWWVSRLYQAFKPNEETHIETGWSEFISEDHWVIWNNWRINKYIPESKKEEFRLMEINNPQRARVESYGLPGSVKGSIYGAYMDKISGLLTPCSFYVGGLDYGYVNDAMTCCLLGTDANWNNINYISEYYYDPSLNQRKKSHNELAEEIVSFYMNLALKHPLIKRGLTIYCDLSERSFISILNETAVKKMANYNWLFFKPCVKLKILARVDKKIMLLSESRFKVNPACIHLLRELRLSVWDEKKATLQVLDKNNHTLDALDYALTSWWKFLNSNQDNRQKHYNFNNRI